MRQLECDRMRFTVGKSWDLKLQIHLLEKGCTQLADIIASIYIIDVGLVLGGCNSKITVCLCLFATVR